MADQKSFHETVTLWPKKGFDGPIITRLFDDEALYYQYIEDNWHNPDYMVEYAGNRHLFHPENKQ